MVKSLSEEEFKDVRDILKEKQEVLPKKIHSIELTANDLLKNIKQKNKSVIDIIKNAVILYGQDKYVDVMKNVTSF